MDIDTLLFDGEERMEKAISALERDFGKLRTGCFNLLRLLLHFFHADGAVLCLLCGISGHIGHDGCIFIGYINGRTDIFRHNRLILNTFGCT